jgi:hypothetical protein
MSAAECRLALDAELAEELGAGYQRSDRFRELLDSTGDAPTDRERALVASYRELVGELRQWDARQQ